MVAATIRKMHAPNHEAAVFDVSGSPDENLLYTLMPPIRPTTAPMARSRVEVRGDHLRGFRDARLSVTLRVERTGCHQANRHEKDFLCCVHKIWILCG